jgi:hypothetical protein
MHGAPLSGQVQPHSAQVSLVAACFEQTVLPQALDQAGGLPFVETRQSSRTHYSISVAKKSTLPMRKRKLLGHCFSSQSS